MSPHDASKKTPVNLPDKQIPLNPPDKQTAIAHLEALREDMRGEIKDRIKQRDQYSIQLTIALASIVAISASGGGLTGAATNLHLERVLVAAPLVSIYFTTLILYSYRVHKMISAYLRTVIEPNLAQLCGTRPDQEWESHYQQHAIPGIRKSFFLSALWIVCVATSTMLFFTEGSQGDFMIPLAIISALYLTVVALITKTFWKG
jgi:hypothetical protein